MDENVRLRVLGIDPSTSNMGVAIIDIDVTKRSKFELVYVSTIKGDKVNYLDPEEHYETAVNLRCEALARAYGELLELYEPDAVICEDNFLGPSPDTFKRLIEMVALLKVQTKLHSPKLHLVNVLPNMAKAIVGANFRGTQKDDIVKVLKLYPRLDLKETNLSDLDDHSTDAIVISLWLAEQLARGYEVLIDPYWVPTSLDPNKDKPKIKGKRRGKRKRSRR